MSNVIFSKSFIASAFFAAALWVYTSLNQEYRTNLSIPIKFNLLQTRAFIEPPPDNITINVKGSGWHLLNSQFSNSIFCNVDLSRDISRDTIYKIYRDLILKNIQNQNYINVIDIYPDNFNIFTGRVADTIIKVIPNVIIKPQEGYSIVGKVRIKPEYVSIRGNESIICKIKSWTTKPYVFEGVNNSINTPIELSDSLRGIVNIAGESFRLIADIQQTAEAIAPDVKVKIIGSNLLKNHTVGPTNLQVTVRGGINIIKNFSPDQVTAFIDYQQIISDSTGYITPVVQVPENLQIISIKPKYLYHKIKS